MNLFHRILFAYIITQVCVWETYGANTCSDDPPDVAGASQTIIKVNQTIVYMCTNGKEFSSGDSVIVSDCTSSGWYSITATCEDNSPTAEACDANENVEQPQQTIRINDTSFRDDYFRVYQCIQNKEWLSGRPIRVMPCRSKGWIKIYDICDESCQIPRDCADVAELNLDSDGEYLVIPSGESNGETTTVHCFLANTEANHGGSWTLIFRNDKSEEMKKSKADYITGFGDPSDAKHNYFIGLNFLANISQNFSDRNIGNVMEVLFYDSSDASMPKYYVTYGNLTVGDEWTTHKLLSVGTHHGNAGDAFCDQVGTNFKYDDSTEGPYWWGVDSSNWASVEAREGNFLSHSSKWPPLDNEGIEFDHVIIRIRPYDFDREFFCPPMVGSHPSWTSTNASIPFNRTVGTEITWWCDGALLYEGKEGGERTKKDTVTCEEGPPPDWSRNVTLPCTTVCPKGFGLLDDGLRCFLFSNASATSFIDATLKCAEMNSTLAVVNTTTDPDKAADNEFYFVNHAWRGTKQTEVEFNITNTGLNCTDENTKVCKADEDNQCAVITSKPSYEFQDCNSSLPYVCEIGTPDPVCPFGYKKYNYLCFSVVKEMATFKEAYEACAKNGSSLAYPTTLAVSSTINLHIIKDFGLTSNEKNEFFVGLNYKDGTWDKHAFKVQKDLEEKLDSSNSLPFRIFTPSSESDWGTYVAVDISYQSTSAKTHALCQYPGPIKCMKKAPRAMLNMQVEWTNKTVVGTELSYWCDEGYAVNKNSSYTVQKVTCYSILRGWYPTLLPCVETPVCTEWPTLGSNNTVTRITNESSYIGGNISFTCPPGLIFNDLRTQINLTCSMYDEKFSFNETQIPACDLCSGSFEHANSTSDYDSTKKYHTGEAVNLKCVTGFQFLSGTSSYQVWCSEDGWNTTGIEKCVEMCTGEVNYGNASSTWNATAYYKIGSENELSCDEGYQYSTGERTQKINCTEWGWNRTGLDYCVQMCTGSVSYGNATSTWEPTDYYPIGSQRELQCNDSYQYLSGEMRQNITCSLSGWWNTTGLEECVKKCEGSLSYENANSTWDESVTYSIGEKGELKCNDGYQYLSGKVKQNVTCAVGGWNVTDLEKCYEKCTGGKFFGNANSTWDPMKHYNIGEWQELECIEGYQYLTGKMNQNISCSVEGWNTTGLKECVPMCKGELSYGNANFSSELSMYYKIGESEDLICDEAYQYLSGKVTQTVNCTTEGWNTTDLEKCVKKCTGSVSYGNANSTWTPSSYYEIGYVGELKCSEDYQYSGGKKTQNITCTEKGWKKEGLQKCGEKCKGGVTYGNANSTWDDSKSYEIGTVEELQCFEGYQYLSGARKQNITCTAEGWDETDLESCVKMCTGHLEYGNANSTWKANNYYPLGDVQTIECNEGYQYLWNDTTQNVTCTKGEWDTSDLENCVEMCNSNVTLKANNEPLPSTKKYFWIGEEAKVECKSGFEYAFEKTTQTIECTEEGWDLSSLKKCSRTCDGDPPKPGKHVVTPLNVTSRGIGDTISYKCESGHFEPLKEGESPPKEIFITCNESGWWESPLWDKPLDCVVLCMDDPPASPANSTRKWDGKSRTKDTSITYECDSGLSFGNLSSTWTLVCDGTDWMPYDKNKFTCAKVCQEDPPEAVSGIVPVDITSRAFGTNLTYKCEKGLHFEPLKENTDPLTNITVECSEDGTWTSPLGNWPHKCVKLCVEDPPMTPKNGTSDWDWKTRLKNTSITYECDGNLLFGNYSSTWVVTCDGTKWLPYDEDIFYCSKTCNKNDLPKPGEKQTNSASGSYATAGESVLYKCDNFTANKDGNKSYEITCQDTGAWDSPPNNFLCENACAGPPEPNPDGVTYNFTGDFREGVIVEYVCKENEFQQYYTKKIYNQCTNKKWTKTVIPSCGERSPFVPVEPLGEYEKHYRETADYWCSEISTCFTESTGGNEADQKKVEGPKGFGQATGLQGQCRIREGNFEDPTTSCILDPSNCDGGGLSYSIWVKHFNYANYLESIGSEEKDDRMYIMSSGGDKDGHPGFAMYHQDNHFLVAVVSTGDQYWTVEAVAQLSAGYWTNVGAIWSKEDGLKLFVNNTKVGDSSVVHTSTKKSPLDPAQVMLGCHKTSTNKTYGGFNKRASMDEFSLWRHELVGQEKDKIMGGFRAEYADKSDDELREIIKNVNTGDSGQADSGANIANLLLNEANEDSDEDNSDVTSTANTPLEGADLETFKKNVETAMHFLQIGLLPQSIPENEAESQMHGLPFVAALLNKKNKKNWQDLQREQDILGASQIIEAMVQYQMEVLRRTKLENGTTVFCREKGKDGVYNKVCKMTMRAFLGMTYDGMIRKPNIYPEAYQKAWNMPYDIAGVFDSIFRNEDCLDRHVSITNTVIDGVDKFVHLGVNRARLDPTRRYRIGSRHISLMVNVDPAPPVVGSVDKKKKLDCNPSREVLKDYPVMYKTEHLEKALAHRVLLFHEGEVDSDIDVRRCALWNANQSDFGVWDPAGCKVVETSAEYTRCACDRMGTFVVLTEEVEPKEVKEEPKWLVILKYILYGLSALLILIYIVVVLVAKDLRDQLHLMGVNLGIAFIAGSAVIICTDFDSITNDRHICVVLGTLLQFFYSAVGFWGVALGHASFRAITRGVIGGNLIPACMMCWGVSLLLTGIPFIEFLQDLGTDPRCFISWENVPKYPFFIPQIVCSIFSMFYAIVILTNLSTPALRKETLVDDYGSFARGAALLDIVISLTWVFGFLTYLRFDFDTDFNPIFQVLNSSTGVCLFLFIGIGSNRWRLFVLGKGKTRRKIVRKYAFGLPALNEGEDTNYLTEDPNRQ